MDSLLVVKARTLKCEPLVQKCILRSLIALGDPRGELDGLNFVVRLPPLDKALLESIAQDFLPKEAYLESSKPGRLDGLGRLLFFRWSWASHVFRQLLTELDPIIVNEDHAGNQVEAFDMAMTLVRRKVKESTTDKLYKRTYTLIQDNNNFIEKLGIIDYTRVNIVPHEDDEETWRLLALIFRENYDHMSNWEGFNAVAEYMDNELQGSTGLEIPLNDDDPAESLEGESEHSSGSKGRENDIEASFNEEISGIGGDCGEIDCVPEQSALKGSSVLDSDTDYSFKERISDQVENLLDLENTWEVWKLIRMLRLLHRRPNNSEELELLYLSTVFKESWKEARIYETDEEDSAYFRGFFPQSAYEGELLHDIMDFFEDNLLQHLTLEFRKRSHQQSLMDPDYYLEYIPWNELSDITDSPDLHTALAELGLSPNIERDISYKIWTTKDNASTCHSLYINDDMYVQTSGGSPSPKNSCINGKVIFRCIPLQDSAFCSDLRHFWPIWNDCALTQHSKDGALFLLETLPGVKARKLAEEYGESAAEAFFSISLNEEDDSYTVQKLLGSEYNPAYKNFLRYVKPEDLAVNDLHEIGAGSYGRVYRTKWMKKPTGEMFDEAKEGDVALKVPFEKNQVGPVRTSKFFEELRTAHAALSSNATGFVKFFGFTRLHLDSRNHLHLQPQSDTSPALILVFDFASEGTVLDYLNNFLKEGEVLSNWEKICGVLVGVATGIKAIHRNHVLHRDIHPNNVLVRYQYFSNSNSVEYDCVLADLGEGKTIDASSRDHNHASFIPTAGSFGMREYKAPEISDGRGYSKMSDMYAFGQLGVDLIRLNYAFLKEAPDLPAKLPLKLMHILEACLENDPKERYEAALAVFMMEEVLDNIRDGKAEWVTDYEFPSAAQYSSIYRSFPSTWNSRSPSYVYDSHS